MIDELKQKHKVIEKNDKFIHKIEVKYPKQNVYNMKQEWSEKLKECNDWLENYDKAMTTTIEMGIDKINTSIKDKQKEYEEFDALTNEEKVAKMLIVFEKDRQQFLEKVANQTKMIDEYTQAVKEEFDKYKKDIETKKLQTLQALNLWNNPERK